MSTKLLIVFLCAAVGTVAGLAVMKRYKRNFLYLDGVCSVISELKRNMSYRRDDAVSVLKRCEVPSAHLKKNIDEYIAFAAAKDGKLSLSRGFLSSAEYANVCALFETVGGSGGAVQASELDGFGTVFTEHKTAAADKLKKYGTAAVKLGFLFGLAVGILTL